MDRYAPSLDENTLLKRAEAVVANRCLSRLGYRRHPLDEAAKAAPEPNIYEFYWFPKADASGYATPADATAGTAWDDTAPGVEKELLSGKLTAYKGRQVPKDGCYGEAGRGLTAGAQPPHVFDEQGMTITRVADTSPRGLIESYVSLIRQALSFQIEKDSRIKQAVSQWAACMDSKGYRYSSPTQAATDKQWQQNKGKAASRAEIATATADMACKKHVRYLDKVIAVESAYEKRYIDQHPKRMKKLLELRGKWQRNAQRVVD
ncbi:hypothetical protein [Streptomyces sp. NPDC050534]|uniref:hypothetical protein n=1 Tax=Streptomyces sp. NPDC050534 TaxID=3365625 RepID=UPI0037AD0F69